MSVVVMVKEQDPFRGVNADTIDVDVYHRLSVRTAQELCKRAPLLKTIFLAPWALREAERNNPSVLRICRERGITILVRGMRPKKNPWKTRRLTPPHRSFTTSHNFLLNLSGEKKDRFEELVLLRFPEALATARYCCLKGEPYLSFPQIAKLYGFCSASAAQSKIKAVLLYLDGKSVLSASQDARRLAIGIEKRIMRLRAKGVDSKELLGSPFVRTPAGMPLTPVRITEFKLVLARSLDGRIGLLQYKNAGDYRALVLRFGLEDGRYRTLDEVGKEMGGVTRQRAEQRQAKALKFLGISSPPKRGSSRETYSSRPPDETL